MSTGFGLFVLISTVGTLLWVVFFLFSNWQTSGEETTGHEWDGIHELDNPLPVWWVGGFLLSVVFAFLYLLYYPGLGIAEGAGNWTSDGQWRAEEEAHVKKFEPLYAELAALPDEELLQSRVARQVGRRLYLNNCSTCHGTTAKGAPGYPNLTDEHWIWGDDLASLQTSIYAGRVAAMPGWQSVLGDAGVAATVDYVWQLEGAPHDAAQAAIGKTHYDAVCIACHGPDGTGNPLLGAPDLTAGDYLYGGDRESLEYTIANGRGGIMPAFDDLLGQDRSRILAGYIKSLQAE